MRKQSVAAVIVLAAAAATPSFGQNWKADIGFLQLQSELNGATPTGAGVPVSFVEDYFPDPIAYSADNIVYHDIVTNAQGQAEYQVTPRASMSTSDPRLSSSSRDGNHANNAALKLFGSGFSFSIAPGVSDVAAFRVNAWQRAGFLNLSGAGQPFVSPNKSRISSHSYQYNSTGLGFENYYRRLDWVAAQDDLLHFTGNTGAGAVSPIGGLFNGISVTSASAGAVENNGATSVNYPRYGSHGLPDGSAYVAGRAKPELVYLGTASDATPTVGAAAALLIQTAHNNPDLSGGAGDVRSYVNASRNNTVIYHAETLEVIKASLLAGARRDFVNSYDGSKAADYRQGNIKLSNAGDMGAAATANGLDRRFGAGEANVYNSYKIITGGQQHSAQDGTPAVGGGISRFGWDYDQAFGGANDSNDTARYGFTANGNGKFIASLVWNVNINGGTVSSFNGAATLYDLDLKLIDITNNSAVAMSSASTIDNTENLWVDLISGHQYMMLVSTKTPTPFSWDYGLAWRSDVTLTPTAVPEPATLGALMLGGGALLLRRKRR